MLGVQKECGGSTSLLFEFVISLQCTCREKKKGPLPLSMSVQSKFASQPAPTSSTLVQMPKLIRLFSASHATAIFWLYCKGFCQTNSSQASGFVLNSERSNDVLREGEKKQNHDSTQFYPVKLGEIFHDRYQVVVKVSAGIRLSSVWYVS